MDLDSKLVSFKNGNLDDFEEIYNCYYKKIYFLCFKILKNEHDSIDATQEVFIQVYKSIGTLRDISKFNFWINKIAISKCSYIIKKNKNIVLDDDNFDNITNSVEEENPELIVCEDENKKIILEMINKLAVKKRTVVLLYYYSELKIEEISNIIKCPTGTVKSRLNSAKRDLKIYLDEYKEGSKLYGMSLPALLLLLKYNSNDIFNIPAGNQVHEIKQNVQSNKSSLNSGKVTKILRKIDIYKVVGIILISVMPAMSAYNFIEKKVTEKVEMNNTTNINNNSEKATQKDTEKISEESVPDKAPEIIGANNVTIKLGDTFDKQKGVYVKDDNNDINTTSINGYVDTNKVGNYTLDYLADDHSGNKTLIKRIITVEK
ncbi:MAG: sigma-70 family RNA polymerase sigma factor [Clostridium sp.]|uniref:sigma-70 family RNA polymerase sigma factor n=1 Tax=Clostridium sp. TaxID=1506 RepID=UPI002FC72BB7